MVDFTKHNPEENRLSRRALLARIGGAGVLAALGAGLLDAVGARPAAASGGISPGSAPGSASPAPGPAVSPATAAGCPAGEIECSLDEGACGGPCEPGDYCYLCTNGQLGCFPSAGEKTICV
jgi:hypothetical protein